MVIFLLLTACLPAKSTPTPEPYLVLSPAPLASEGEGVRKQGLSPSLCIEKLFGKDSKNVFFRLDNVQIRLIPEVNGEAITFSTGGSARCDEDGSVHVSPFFLTLRLFDVEEVEFVVQGMLFPPYPWVEGDRWRMAAMVDGERRTLRCQLEALPDDVGIAGIVTKQALRSNCTSEDNGTAFSVVFSVEQGIAAVLYAHRSREWQIARLIITPEKVDPMSSESAPSNDPLTDYILSNLSQVKWQEMRVQTLNIVHRYPEGFAKSTEVRQRSVHYLLHVAHPFQGIPSPLTIEVDVAAPIPIPQEVSQSAGVLSYYHELLHTQAVDLAVQRYALQPRGREAFTLKGKSVRVGWLEQNDKAAALVTVLSTSGVGKWQIEMMMLQFDRHLDGKRILNLVLNKNL